MAAKKNPHKSAPVKAPAKTGSETMLGDTHELLIATGLMGLFLLLMVMFAGISKTTGRLSVLVMVILLTNQAIRHVNPFVTWVQDHPLTPDGGVNFTGSVDSGSK